MKKIVVATLMIGFAAEVHASEVDNIVAGEQWSSNLDTCVTSVDDRLYELSYDPDSDETFQNSSFREILIAGWGAITCPGEMTLRSLAPDLLPEERENFCLVYSKKRRTYLGYAQGRRDTYWQCKDAVDFQKADIAPRASFVFPASETATSNSIARCTALIRGKHYRLTYDFDDDELINNMSFRDALIGGDCPGQAILSALVPELSSLERSAFCLVYDDKTEEYLGYAEGERDAYLKCKKPSVPICERVNATKAEALAIVGLGAGATAGATTVASAAGVTAVTHSSGAVILTGSSGYIAGTIGTVGSSILGVLTLPATLTAAAVSVVAVGGAVYVCQPDSDNQE